MTQGRIPSFVARFYILLTFGNFGSHILAFRSLGVLKNDIWTITDVIRNARLLDVRVSDSVRQYNRSEVDVFEFWCRGESEFLILPVYHAGKIGCIRTPVTFRRHMEWLRRILRETLEENLEKGVDILAGDRASVNSRPVIRVGEPNLHRLVEEKHVGVVIPAVGVICDFLSAIGYGTRAEFP